MLIFRAFPGFRVQYYYYNPGFAINEWAEKRIENLMRHTLTKLFVMLKVFPSYNY